jgi:hypothetical protein
LGLISSNIIRIPRVEEDVSAGRELRMRIAKLAVTVVVASAISLYGQQPGAAQNGTAPAASAKWQPSRLPDGQPDVQGHWRPVNGGTFSLTNPMTGGAEFAARINGTTPKNPSRIVDPPDGLVPYQPWAAARQKQQASVET